MLHAGYMKPSEFVEERLERRFAKTPAMLHSINCEGRLVSVSDAWLAKLGYERQEVLGRFSSEFLTPQSRDHAIKHILPEFFRTGRCENVEYQMVCKDGQIIDVLMSAVLEQDELDVPPVSLCVVTDITSRKIAEQRLVQSAALYRSLIEDQTEFVSLSNRDGVLLFVNDAYAALHNNTPVAMIGRNLIEFVEASQRESVAAHLSDLCAAGGSAKGENQVVLPGGRTIWVEWTNRVLTDAAGHVTAIHSVGRDIEQQLMNDRLLKDSETRYRLLADHSTDMVFQLDRSLIRRYVSPACREVLGYEPEQLIGAAPVNMVHPEDADRVASIYRSMIDGDIDRCSSINRIRHRDGHWIWVEAQFRTLRDLNTNIPSGIIGALRDISARKAVEDELAEAHQKLETLARIDGLTGLANRRTFDDVFATEFKRAERHRRALAVVMIDVDFFKSFNDYYGHPAGDVCLRQISQAISQSALRPSDLAARYGGEEFVLLLPDTDEAGAALIAERTRHAIEALAIEHHASMARRVTVSAGIASVGLIGLGLRTNDLLQRADAALYQAKSNGRNTVVLASQSAQPSNSIRSDASICVS